MFFNAWCFLEAVTGSNTLLLGTNAESTLFVVSCMIESLVNSDLPGPPSYDVFMLRFVNTVSSASFTWCSGSRVVSNPPEELLSIETASIADSPIDRGDCWLSNDCLIDLAKRLIEPSCWRLKSSNSSGCSFLNRCAWRSLGNAYFSKKFSLHFSLCCLTRSANSFLVSSLRWISFCLCDGFCWWCSG